MTPLGLTFSKLAGLTSGGAQNHGFYACSFNTIKQDKFLRGDGGWDRIVWMPAYLKKDLVTAIPEEVYEKIATEADAIEPDDLTAYLAKVKHPVTKKFWKDGKPQPVALAAPCEMYPGDEDYYPGEE